MVTHRVRKLLSDVGYTLKHNHVTVVFDGIRDLLISDCVKTVVRLCFWRPAEPQHGGGCGLPACHTEVLSVASQTHSTSIKHVELVA